MSEITVLKRCSTCGYEKPLTDFRKQKKSKDGLKYICRECDNIWNKKRYQEKRDEILFKIKLWQSEHPEKLKVYKKRYADKHKLENKT